MRARRFTVASSGQQQSLPNHCCPSEILFDECAARLKDQLDGLTEVSSRLIERLALSIGTGEFLNERDVAAIRILTKHCGEFECHDPSL
jgi:hypothetical protein